MSAVVEAYGAKPARASADGRGFGTAADIVSAAGSSGPRNAGPGGGANVEPSGASRVADVPPCRTDAARRLAGRSGPSGRPLPDGRRLHLHHGPIDLIVEALGTPAAVEAACRRATRAFEPVLGTLAEELGALRRPLGRHAPSASAETPRGPVARRMHAAALPHAAVFVTPMAAVAGAVADFVLEAMLDGAALDGATLARVSINNGGDIAFRLAPGETFVVGLCVDPRSGEGGGRVTIGPDDGIGGIATSGRHGRSHSLGVADAVTVLAASAAEADVAATLIANACDLPGDPRVTRVPAHELSPDSDLGARAVTVDVPRLDATSRARAIAAGVRAAEACLRAGTIVGAFVHLQGETATVGRHASASAGRPSRPPAAGTSTPHRPGALP